MEENQVQQDPFEQDVFDFGSETETPADVTSEPTNEVDDSDLTYETDDFQAGEETDSDYISELLQAKGYDKDNIPVYDEEGNLDHVTFDSLSKQEKIDLLSMEDEQVLPTDDEIDTLNFLRQNNMSLKDFAEYSKQQGVQEYLASQPMPQADIDQYSDDEVIAYDFIQRFGEDMSDEEIDAEIDRLKSDPDAYQKRVEMLRNGYRNEQAAQQQLYQQEEQQRSAADNQNFVNAYVQSANDLNYIQGIELDNNDKNDLLNFILTKDVGGRTGLSKAMDDPQNVLRMAWYLMYGEQAFDAVVDHFQNEISKRSRVQQGPKVVNKNQRTLRKDAFKF